MYQTIRLASCVLVQGEMVKVLENGQVVIRDGMTEYRGAPVMKRTKDLAPAVFEVQDLSVQTA